MSDDYEMPKSEMLRRSLRCFVLGWWSLFPVLGVVPGILAFLDFHAVVLHKGRRWNAARTCLLVGALLAGLGVLISMLVGALIASAILKRIAEA